MGAFDKGLVEVTNADTAMTGTSNGRPYLYYCISSYYWNTYKARCNATLTSQQASNSSTSERPTMATTPTTEFNSADRARCTSSATATRTLSATSGPTTNPLSPTRKQPVSTRYHRSVLDRIQPVLLLRHVSQDCSVYYRVMPYEGKGTDVTADITSDPVWDLTDSPIRINPSNDYLVVSSDLTIKPGVEILVAAGKGISFDGACTR